MAFATEEPLLIFKQILERTHILDRQDTIHY
jgi:hypothetical protein